MTDNLKMVLKYLADFDDEALDEIAACFKPKSAKKGDLLLHEGNVCREFYYVHTGCLRVYFIDRNGHEKTRYVMPDNHIGTALASFIAQAPSVEFVEALADTELLVISHSSFSRLRNEKNSFRNFYIKILEMAYAFQNRKINQLVTLTARQRYEMVLKETPALVQLLSNKVLASYLDIREETLSRLKSR